jgi:isopentenyldiphosphate isomerase
MAKMEPLDLYNARGEPLGLTKPRALVHQDGDWHRTFHCWVVYTDAAGQDTMVFQQRGSQVARWQNKLDITAAGHYQAGEGIEGGIREIQEELGILTTPDRLIYAGIRICLDEFQPGVIDHEFQEVYFLVDQRDLTAYTPQIEEVGGLAAIPIPLLLALLAAEIDQLVAPGVLLQPDVHQGQALLTPHEFVVTRTDFIPSLDRYYHRAAILAQRILQGERYIWI